MDLSNKIMVLVGASAMCASRLDAHSWITSVSVLGLLGPMGLLEIEVRACS